MIGPLLICGGLLSQQAHGDSTESDNHKRRAENGDASWDGTVIEGLQQNAKGENDGAGKESQRKRCLSAFRKADAIEANSDNDQQYRQTYPMAMNIHLAVVSIFGFRVLSECSFGSGRISPCGSVKGQREGRTNIIQRLMLGKNGVPQAVAHAPQSQSDAAQNEKPPAAAHRMSVCDSGVSDSNVSSLGVELTGVAEHADPHRQQSDDHQQASKVRQPAGHKTEPQLHQHANRKQYGTDDQNV